MSDDIRDEFGPAEVERREEIYDGLRWDLRADAVRLHNGEVVRREYLVHPGAVGIIALDDEDRVLLVKQYRHPAGHYLWEPPAGLMDSAGESALATAKRELYEEAGCVAEHWNVLLDWFNTPGGSTEAFRCFLARGVAEHSDGRPQRGAEESDMPLRWVPLADAIKSVMAGDFQNPTAAAGLLAAGTARGQDWEGLRPGDAPWPVRERLLESDRVWLPN